MAAAVVVQSVVQSPGPQIDEYVLYVAVQREQEVSLDDWELSRQWH